MAVRGVPADRETALPEDGVGAVAALDGLHRGHELGVAWRGVAWRGVAWRDVGVGEDGRGGDIVGEREMGEREGEREMGEREGEREMGEDGRGRLGLRIERKRDGKVNERGAVQDRQAPAPPARKAAQDGTGQDRTGRRPARYLGVRGVGVDKDLVLDHHAPGRGQRGLPEQATGSEEGM